MSDLTTKTEPARSEVPASKPNAAERVCNLVAARSSATIWDGEHAYAIVQMPGHVRTLPVGSSAFRRWCFDEGRRTGDRPPSRDAFGTAEQMIEARAEADGGIQAAPSIRVAGREGVVYFDLGNNDWTCAKVTKDGWTIEPHPLDGPYMYRPPRMDPLPEPERGGSIDELWEFLNVRSDRDRALLVAAMIQMLWPRGPYPVLTIFGEQGSAKSTTEQMIKSIVDPTRATPDSHALTSLKASPREERDITSAANNARVIGFDNVSFMPDWLSDVICRLATGADIGGRELYSDFDEAIVSAVRPVMINGIPAVTGRSDLADRSVMIEAVPPEVRREEAEIWQRFKEARPRLLGALLDALSITLRRHGSVVIPSGDDVRMADFLRLGEAAGPAIGLEDGEFAAHYRASRATAAREVAELDSLTPRLQTLVEGTANGCWSGLAGELLTLLTNNQPMTGKGWHSSPKALANHLTRQTTPLRAVGISVEKIEGRHRSPISGDQGTLYSVSRLPADKA